VTERAAPAHILVRGEGIAARCCAHLLASAGLRVSCERTDRPRIPAVLLSDAALALIRDVFGQPTLLTASPRIERRVVAWGGEPVAVPHGAIVVPETALIDALPMNVGPMNVGPEVASPADLIVQAAPSPAVPPPHRFGSRRAVTAEVRLRTAAESASCWIEALAAGWLFLLSGADGACWLLAVGEGLDELLASSRLIAPLVAEVRRHSGSFDACPRIAEELQGEGWLACGTAAIAFDPICGDGAAQAVREAILASAVIIGMAQGGDGAALRSHYQAMLTASMRRHLKLCADFYRTGGDGPWWSAALRALVEGHDWCTQRLANAPEPRYRLRGFRLVLREE
jgi:hypothetical protein